MALTRLRRAAVCLLACVMLPGWLQAAQAEETVALQQAVNRAMRGKSGAAVVIDVTSGKVLAAYRPDIAGRRLALPGSAIKPFTLITLIESGKVNAQAGVVCKRSMKIGGHDLSCTHPPITQPFDASAALAYSCNTYFATMAARLTPSELQRGFLRYGFGSPSGLMPNEAAGAVELASSTEELQMEAVGEAGLRVTPLQLLRAFQTLARMEATHDHRLNPVYEGLRGAVSYGMGHAAQPQMSMSIAGKTGTSLVEEGPWRHGWFAGYAPANDPKIALVVFLEKGNGPVDAAGVAREIFAAYAAFVGSGGAR